MSAQPRDVTAPRQAKEGAAEVLVPLLGTKTAILHGLEEAESDRGGDIDLAVWDADHLWPLRMGTGWGLRQCLHYDGPSRYWIVERDGVPVALDATEDPDGLGRYGFPLTFDSVQDISVGVKAAYLAAKRIRKGRLDRSQWSAIRDLAARDLVGFRVGLQAVFGDAAAEVYEAARQGEVPGSVAWNAARRAQRRSRVRTYGRAERMVLGETTRAVGRIAHPTGAYVLVVGPDGSGKSTVAQALPDLCDGFFRRHLHVHWRPHVLPRLGALLGRAPADPTRPHDRPPRGRIPSLALLSYYWWDHFLGAAFKIWPARVRTGLVVVERGWWDLAVDPRRYRLQVPAWLVSALGRLLPAPDLVLSLEAPAGSLRARKAELGEEELARQTEAWRRAAPRRARRVTLDASRPEREVLAESRKQVADFLEDRAMTRLGAGWTGLPSRTSARWALPRGPARAARAGLLVYQPVTLRGRVGWEAARLLASAGGLRLFPRGEAPPAEVREALAPYLPPHNTLAVARSNHPNRHVALVVGQNGHCHAVAKVAGDGPGREALEREASAIRSLGPLLDAPLRAPRILGQDEGVLLVETIRWRARSRPWVLPTEVARALGEFFRRGASEGDELVGPVHGDCAPWNLLRTEDGWVLVDWEEASPRGAPFFDLFHYLVQTHALLRRPSYPSIVKGLGGRGRVGRLIEAYARGADLDPAEAEEHFNTYLETSGERLRDNVAGDRSGIAARRRLSVRDAPSSSTEAPEVPQEMLAAVRSLAADAITLEVVPAFRKAGIRSILLKGPVLADWLYEDSVRSYGDSDILVDVADLDAAEETLSELGFEHPPLDDIPHDRPWHAHAWIRKTKPVGGVDLHRTLIGVGVQPAELWRVLSARTERMRVSRLELEVLDPGGRALHVALHAAQDGTRRGKPLTDLARALDRVPDAVWRDALTLAEQLDALPAFAVGLRLLPQGEALAARLGVPAYRSVEVALRASAAPPLSLGFDWLATTPGLRQKAAFLARKMIPPTAFMRAWSPIARRGRAGLILAYLWRQIWLLVHAGPGLRAWSDARRERPPRAR